MTKDDLLDKFDSGAYPFLAGINLGLAVAGQWWSLVFAVFFVFRWFTEE